MITVEIRKHIKRILCGLSMICANLCLAQHISVTVDTSAAVQPTIPTVLPDDSSVHYYYLYQGTPYSTYNDEFSHAFVIVFTEQQTIHYKTNGTQVCTLTNLYYFPEAEFTWCPGDHDAFYWGMDSTRDCQYDAQTSNGTNGLPPDWGGSPNINWSYKTTDVTGGTIKQGEALYSFYVPPTQVACGVRPGIFFWGKSESLEITLDLYPTNTPPTAPKPTIATYNYTISSTNTQLSPSSPTLNSNGQFLFTLNGQSNVTYTVQASTNLSSWITVASVTPSGPTYSYTDTSASSFVNRFYRYTDGTNGSGAIGFIKLIAVPGYTFIADQLIDLDGNTLGNVLPSVPNGSKLSKWDTANQAFVATTFSGPPSNVWDDDQTTLFPGEGGVFYNPTTNNVTLQFFGLVPQGTLNVGIQTNGENLMSSMVPKVTDLTSLGFPAINYDVLWQWNPSTQQYNQGLSYDSGNWYDNNYGVVHPTPNIGEAFFINSAANQFRTWTNSYSVWP
jgi:hypothetical protein